MRVLRAFAIGKRHVGAGFGQSQCNGAPDTAAPAGDDGVAAIKREGFHHMRRLRLIERRAASAMAPAPMPQCSARSPASPDSPKRSFTPTNSIGANQARAM